MIRSWIAIVALLAGASAIVMAEELPAPKVTPPPPVANPPVSSDPAPKATVPELPLPDIGVPSKPMESKPAEGPALTDPLPATEPPKVVAPSTLLPAETTPNAPASAFPSPAPNPQPAPNPLPAPSVVVPANPNLSGKTPALPEEGALAPANTPNNNVPAELKWRYKWHNGQWWYWSPDDRWMIWDKNTWTIYDPATYQAPAGFAKPGPRVVTRQSLPALPENYSGAEVSTPESYYIAPTPYAFGADSYYGPHGPAASYYNRRSSLSISIGTAPAYVPIYDSYLAPQYFYNPRYGGARYTAPVGVYPGYIAPGYYGGRGVTIGFGF